jgi:excisionase family DNA binding protein
MSDLGRALLDQLGPDDLEQLARLLGPYMHAAPSASDGWLTTREAADHLGLSVHALHRLTSTRQVPFSQAGPGAKCYFRRSDLDAWRSVRP